MQNRRRALFQYDPQPLFTIGEHTHHSPAMSYTRNLSPGSRRILNPARASDSTVDAYHSARHNSYASPRSSGERVIPISTQTFVNVAPSNSSTSRSSAYDSYTGRARRSSLLDQGRSSISGSSRRPNVIQGSEAARTTSPSRMREYYVVPAISKEPKHRKVYSIDDGNAKLVTEPASAGAESSGRRYRHSRKDSEDRGYKDDRARRGYPITRKDKSIDDEDAFSYTDAAGMYRDTQPSWRERDVRSARRSSLDRGASRERPVSIIDTYGADPRRSREGPPPSQRGWDKINDLGRARSVREAPREVAQSPSRGRGDEVRGDQYYNPRRTSVDRSKPATIHHDQYDSAEDHEPELRHSRRLSVNKRHDRSVSRRGFGIRSDSKDRPDQQYSNESLDGGRKNRELDNTRREYASEAEYREPVRRKHEGEDRSARQHDRRREADKYESDVEDRRHHHREDNHRRYEDDDPHSSRTGFSDTAKLAAGGLAGAAALYGVTRDRDRDRDRTDDAPHEPERRHRREPEQDRRPADAPYPSERQNEDHGLGFAFEEPSRAPAKARGADPIEPNHDPSSLPDRILERSHEDPPKALEMPLDPDEEYRRRMLQTQRELGLASMPTHENDPERERRRREREARLQERHERTNGDVAPGAYAHEQDRPRASFSDEAPESSVASTRPSELRRRPSIIDQPMPSEPTAQIIDNSLSEKRENRVRIVDPPTEEEDKRPKSILKKPTAKFPEDHNSVREGVAPLKDVSEVAYWWILLTTTVYQERHSARSTLD